MQGRITILFEPLIIVRPVEKLSKMRLENVLKAADASKVNTSSPNSFLKMKILSMYSEMIKVCSVVITNLNI